MKKYFSLFLVIITMTLLSGCGFAKTLECEKSYNENGIDQVKKVKAWYKDDALVKVKLDTTVDLTGKDESYVSSYKEALDTTYKDYFNKTGIKALSKVDSSKVYLKVVFDLEEISDKDKQTLGIDSFSKTLEDAEKDYVSDGYTCKQKDNLFFECSLV